MPLSSRKPPIPTFSGSAFGVLRSVSGFGVPESERVFYAELHDSWVPCLRRDLPECLRIHRRGRVAPVEVVQQVECLQAELEIPGAAQRHDSRQRQVDCPETGTFNGIEARIAQRAQVRQGKRG